MSKIIDEQLKKCQVADTTNFNPDTNEYFIKRRVGIKIKVGSYYILKIKDSLLNPSPNSTLAANWNNGIIPTHNYYKVDVCQIMARMIKVNGIAFNNETQTDINEFFSGWLPIDEIEIISELT